MSSAGPAPEEDVAGEGLLRRWARRKRAAQVQPAAPAAIPASAPASGAAPDAVPVDEPAPVLPALDTLDASSDYGAFLQHGVPAELQRLALQRAWSSDAAIAEFRGMAEYAWDFNAPQYGQLWAVDDVARLIQAVIAPPLDAAPAPEPVTAEVVPTVPDAVADAAPAPEAAADGVEAEAGMDQAPPLPRRHGSALPC